MVTKGLSFPHRKNELAEVIKILTSPAARRGIAVALLFSVMNGKQRRQAVPTTGTLCPRIVSSAAGGTDMNYKDCMLCKLPYIDGINGRNGRCDYCADQDFAAQLTPQSLHADWAAFIAQLPSAESA
jgi:hypothetical protein